MLFNAVALASILSLLAVTKATPVQVVPRSFQSAGLDCYFTCPDVDGATLTSAIADDGNDVINQRPYAQCVYSFSGPEYCEYYTDDGTLQNGTPTFPAQADLAGCGADFANSGTYPYNFKRSMIPRAKRETAAQRRIRSLQYSPTHSS